MTKHKNRVATFLLLVLLPLPLFARGPLSGEPMNGPAQYFSLSIYDTSAAQTIPARAWCSMPAPSIPPTSEKFTFKSLSRDFLKDAGQIWSYPVHIRTRDILPIAGLAVLTGFLIAEDEAIYQGFRNYRDGHAWVRDASPVVTQMGSYGAWGTVGAFLCFGLIAKDGKAVETAALASNAMLQSAILIKFIKGLAGRQRPSWADGVDHWSGPAGFFKRFESEFQGKFNSFPSGHTITAFTLATVVAMQYRESVWVPILTYTMATGVGLSRLTEDKHWLSDVLVGGVLGHVIGRLVVRNHRHRYHLRPDVGIAHGSPSFAITFSSHL